MKYPLLFLFYQIIYNLSMASNYATMIKGRKNVVYARVGEVNTTSFSVVHFAKRNTKNYGGEKRSGEAARQCFPKTTKVAFGGPRENRTPD
ncbi:hypothetical protein COY65_01830 [Candidatus Jorgensenbacteria bacterium CG_4_10_14_0_8_um_filter_39_13]|uniref:Uncharacterized protein n=1 Tax=Candidatus Jorgensenbacteria bacterium CG_4_10_14_0_8_um_filter_39_13 TaxID=1974589 RepID=A0A2M7RHF9_9BACT|nr:MAG: hypothetical protein COZ81_01120 [Candidatus Jorgensenbacteria bacterium CG_4_8_14_3_um_filter_38_10]PIY96002.1 MAG: hypothetical protein COY65_01830 [Candidatus Jorgensenbacteria bacterium CG_4_10_14_0_8_um_filter_39_13]PJA95103.1 MAG: hypothetical protein CO130_00995 [Candidatus Jorgensenbacteria bacterium CG_4_9_14_3_um_filter_38_10]